MPHLWGRSGRGHRHKWQRLRPQAVEWYRNVLCCRKLQWYAQKWAHLPRLAGEIVHTCVYGFASSGEWIRNNLRKPSPFVGEIRSFAFSQLLGKAFSALLPNSLTRYARKVKTAKTTVPPQMGECCHTVRKHTAIEKGLGCSPNKSLCMYKDIACKGGCIYESTACRGVCSHDMRALACH